MKDTCHLNSIRFTLAIIVLSLILPQWLKAATPLSTLVPTNVTASTATLKGSVTPGATPTTVWFEWGPGNAIQFSTPHTNIGTGTNPVIFTASISNLIAGNFHQCRAVASSSSGVVRGFTQTFASPAMTSIVPSAVSNLLNTAFIDPGVSASNAPVAIAVGDSHTLALKADGRVAGWGTNDAGQLNITNAATNIVAIAAGNAFSLGLIGDGSVVGWGTDDSNQIDISPEASNVVAISAGYAHSLALRKDGSIIGWGYDTSGETLPPPVEANYIAIAAGGGHSLALRSDGTVTQWGQFVSDLIPKDPPASATNVVAISAGFDHSLALRSDGTVVAWGWGPQTNVPSNTTNIVAIAAGYYHSLALRADGTVLGWGTNAFGELAIPSEATNVIAIGAGFGRSQALLADGTVIGWGDTSGASSAYAGQTNTVTGLTVSLPVTITGTVISNVAGTYPVLYRATNILGFAATGTRTVTLIAPKINSQGRQGNGNFLIGVDLIPGKTLTVLASTNPALPMTSWTLLGTATESPAGHYSFTDTGAPSQPKRFYRFRLD